MAAAACVLVVVAVAAVLALAEDHADRSTISTETNPDNRPATATTDPNTPPPIQGEATSWAKGPAACSDTIPNGVEIVGDGTGICIGAESPQYGLGNVWLVVGGEQLVAIGAEECGVLSSDYTTNMASVPIGDSDAILGAVSPTAAIVSVVVQGQDAPAVARTFTVPGIDGVNYFATIVPGHGTAGPIYQYDADGNPLTWDPDVDRTYCQVH